MAKFVKIEQLVASSGVKEMWVNPDYVTAVYEQDNLTKICWYDGAKETTKLSIDEVLKVLSK